MTTLIFLNKKYLMMISKEEVLEKYYFIVNGTPMIIVKGEITYFPIARSVSF